MASGLSDNNSPSPKRVGGVPYSNVDMHKEYIYMPTWNWVVHFNCKLG